MFLLKLATRNLFRNPRRSILTTVTLVIGIIGFVASSGMVRGIESTFIQTEIDTESGHLRIFRKGFLKEEENFPLDIRVAQPQKLTDAIQKKWPQSTVMQRIVFSGKLSDGQYGVSIRGLTVDTQAAEKVLRLSKFTTKKKPMPNRENIMVLGAQLAKAFNKKPGDTLTLEIRTSEGSLDAPIFTIYDVIETGNPMIDNGTIYLPMKAGAKLLFMKKARTDLIVRLKDKKQTDAVVAFVGKTTPQNYPQTWVEKSEAVVQLNNVRRKMFNFMTFIILMIAAAGLANTMLMNGFERRGEIGMMMAMGMPRTQVVKMFAFEAGILGFFSSILGSIVGGSISWYYKVYGLDISGKMDAYSDKAINMSFSNIIYFEFTPEMIVAGIFIGTFVSILAAIWPAMRITALEPRDILAGG